MPRKYIKIVTHAGTHHADEILALATIFEFVGELPVERKNKAEEAELENPQVLVLDIGGRLEPEKGNFDHHQNGNIPATNMLALNHFCQDEKLKAVLRKELFSSVDAIDRGIFTERPIVDYKIPNFNSLVRSLNNVENGFDKALMMARTLLSAEIAKAEKSIKSEEIWNSLEKQNKIAIQQTAEQVVDWREFAERDGTLLLITPNERIPGAYQVMSRDTGLIVIPETDAQLYRHPSGFLAVYATFREAFGYSTEIINAYIYQAECSIK